MHIFPSLIASDLLNIQSTLTTLDPYVDGYHIDIMDNYFVPNLTWGPCFVNAIARATIKPLWIHIMTADPLSIIKKLTVTPSSMVSFHVESTSNKNTIIKFLKENNIRFSLAISPKTPLDDIFPFIESVDHILIMSVNPGSSGQQFLTESFTKIDQLVHYRSAYSLCFDIGVDGGINAHNISTLMHKGVSNVGVASAIFDSNDPLQSLKTLKHLIREYY